MRRSTLDQPAGSRPLVRHRNQYAKTLKPSGDANEPPIHARPRSFTRPTAAQPHFACGAAQGDWRGHRERGSKRGRRLAGNVPK
jgi:hypothetical protein